jgi:SpoVK/Ycf46/Vps4 family AAA+-type ATPase
MVPSSARATASAAVPLPTQLIPLLSSSLEQLKSAVDRALPPVKKRSVLEEAEYEDDDDGSSFAKEVMLQCKSHNCTILILALETLRVYRPRVVLHGPSGLGQTYLGPAILHHLEGYHVQSFDLATLMSDSTRVSRKFHCARTHALDD